MVEPDVTYEDIGSEGLRQLVNGLLPSVQSGPTTVAVCYPDPPRRR